MNNSQESCWWHYIKCQGFWFPTYFQLHHASTMVGLLSYFHTHCIHRQRAESKTGLLRRESGITWGPFRLEHLAENGTKLCG